MENKSARPAAIAGLFLEVSALLAVFPMLEQLVGAAAFSRTIAGIGIAGALLLA